MSRSLYVYKAKKPKELGGNPILGFDTLMQEGEITSEKEYFDLLYLENGKFSFKQKLFYFGSSKGQEYYELVSDFGYILKPKSDFAKYTALTLQDIEICIYAIQKMLFMSELRKTKQGENFLEEYFMNENDFADEFFITNLQEAFAFFKLLYRQLESDEIYLFEMYF